MINEQYPLEGTKEVLDSLSSLDDKTLINIIRAVERKALNEKIVKPLRSAIPHQSLKKTIGIQGYRREKLWMSAGATMKSKETWPPMGLITRWVDKGTKLRETKQGWNRGQITGMNIISPLILSSASSIIDFFNKDFGTAVDEQLKKRLKRMNK